MTAPAIDTHHLVIEVGKHAGVAFTRLPVGYLRWMVSVRHASAAIAQAELDRRGTVNPELDVSHHAIDRVSLQALSVYMETRRPDEGLAAWLVRAATEALETEPVRPGRYTWGPLVLVYEMDTVWPVLKTVIYDKKAARKRAATERKTDVQKTETEDTLSITLEPVQSSQIAAIGHDPKTNTLAVKFADKPNAPGGLYHYANFSSDDFAAFSKAASPGAHFHVFIKSVPHVFPCQRIAQPLAEGP